MAGFAEEASSTLNKGGDIMTDVTNNPAALQEETTESQTQSGNQGGKKKTLGDTVRGLRMSSKWIEKTEEKSTLIKLRKNLDLTIPAVQAEIEKIKSIDVESDAALMLEQQENLEKWEDHLSTLQRARKELTKRAADFIKKSSGSK